MKKGNPPSIVLEHYNASIANINRNQIFNQVLIFKIIYGVAEGMRYVHFKNIIHRNLNPKNIFIIDDNMLKIGEFGISTLYSLDEQLSLSSQNILGDIQYIAPELQNAEIYDKSVDVYSFGVLFYYLLNERKLPTFDKNNEIGKKIPETFNKYASEFIKKCISIDPKDRPSFEVICKFLTNNYKKMFKINEVQAKEINRFFNQLKTIIPVY